MITLFQPPKALGLCGSTSPPSFKLETWLRIAGVPFASAWPPTRQAPKGKFPFIDDDGALLGDSTLIIEHLKRTRGVDPDEGLTPEQRAIGLAFRRMVKENLYWVLVHGRYKDPSGWSTWRPVLASMLVPPGASDEDMQRGLGIADEIQKRVFGQMEGHGIGRHTDEEIHQLGSADLAAISDFLGDKPFFFGDRPTTADAAVYAHVANFIDLPFDNESARFARGRDNLTAYAARMRARFFGG